MVTVKWKIEDKTVYLKISNQYFSFTRKGNKRFSLRQLMIRNINHYAYEDPFVNIVTSGDGWNWGSISLREAVKKFKVIGNTYS